MRRRPPGIGAVAATLAVASALVAGIAAADPLHRGLLFRLDRTGVPPSYVFGTLHSADPRVTALPAPVRRAFDDARTFAPEIHLSERDIADFFANAQFDDGRRLTDYVDTTTFEAIRAGLGAAAPPDATLARMKPWAVLLKLAELPAAATDGDGQTLDGALLAEARQRRLAIVGLELPDEQVAAFDAIPLASQLALIRFVLAERGALAREHDAVVAAWLDRDLGKLAALNAAPGRRNPALAPHLAELTRHLVEDRSVQMAHRLTLPLKRGRVFVAVGASHLYGERSLLALLREQGYRVRRVWRPRRAAGGRRMSRRRTARPASACRSGPRLAHCPR
jgi:uncharacterized protein